MNSTNTSTITAAAPAAVATAVSADDFDYLRGLLKQRSAIEIAPGQEYLVESRLSPVARQYALADVSAVIAALRTGTSSHLVTDVVDAMTTNETSFFRDQHPFTELVEHVIPDILARRGPTDPLTIWCAACSSGQEPYTLAIMLHEHFPQLVQQHRLHIFASDLSPTMVKRCAEGRYSQFEVNRGLPAKYLVTYFEQVGRDWVVRQDLRSAVKTRVMNLIEPWPAMPTCDLVLLRNVLIYFSSETKKLILDRMASTVLKPDGYLMLGSSESLLSVDVDYQPKTFERGTFHTPPRGAR